MSKKHIVQSLEEQATIINQLNQAKEQIEGIKGMIKNEENYYKIIKQIEAARIVLNNTERLFLESRMISFC
ncbi:metal-sensing transcriptional repressor [Alkaliphilus peptidifermentans]|uniref:Metal-sensitive transcriptional repressor n=1 Tax=Alkaliphilus peptidifermentans DSM 18978 TaxID=1120976 RepID=A0A1G5C150_9FIRM|nr:metal-sensing transcriptional repressor [Alkaliphilus peptidifermentans]SCX96108.1 Metal-sensitive transcriptional repressor [Alkaliphilus peptidifermentans DSM 18978]